MKLIIEKELFVKNLDNVCRALSTRNIIPVLNGIKFELKKSGLFLTASDNEISIEVNIDKKDIKSIEEVGSVVVANGSKLLELLKRINKKEITIQSLDENEIIFSSDKFEYKSNCFVKEDFPNINFEEVENPIKLDSKKFKEIINNTVFACSLQESRPLLTGINIKIVGNLFECVSTDSYRLSKIQVKLNNIPENNFNIVIPSKNVNELYRIINSDNEIELHIYNNKILFIYENMKFISSLLNGTYPNTDNSIPKEFKNQIKVKTSEMLNLVTNASLISQSKDKNIVEMEVNNSLLTIRANSQDGKFEDTIEIENISKNNIKISYSSKYMADALKIYDSEYVLILMNGEISPIIINKEQNDEITELILPMKTY